MYCSKSQRMILNKEGARIANIYAQVNNMRKRCFPRICGH
ncbi:hypothetical protein HMPREF3196_01847 [Bifidobacterium bifidum]|uniref:Uncharacterized protein n=1 Tax=Bifidobacterium bifidum TaxID=1681 RepID=A0A133KL58_BIFBI|nr:hypothetical protein BIFBIF_01611 [Bifidobacterium bifidum ATCC 29521 = JCM 1255 = DSM 20456]KWZ80264.1 hypothetical protein HMPREF3196_01847 [Bifidobacterium bifidum]